MIPNLDASVSWWTTWEAARIFWVIFALAAAAFWIALARRRRGRANSSRR
jgi:cyanate permease